MLELSPLERSFLERSGDTSVTKRRNRMALVTGGVLIASFCVAALMSQSLVLVIVVSITYMLASIFERVAYGNAVIVYKRLIQKLSQRVAMLERQSSNEEVVEENSP
jgi:hypothetical protein